MHLSTTVLEHELSVLPEMQDEYISEMLDVYEDIVATTGLPTLSFTFSDDVIPDNLDFMNRIWGILYQSISIEFGIGEDEKWTPLQIREFWEENIYEFQESAFEDTERVYNRFRMFHIILDFGSESLQEYETFTCVHSPLKNVW